MANWSIMTAELQNSIKVIPIDLMPSTVEFHLISEAPICGTLIRMTDRTTYVFGLCDYVKSCGFFRAVSMWLESSLVPQEILHSDHWGLISWCHRLWAPRLSDFPKDSSFTSSKKKMKNVSLCWQISLSSIPPCVGNSSQFHFPSHSTIPLNPYRPKTQSNFGSKAKQFSHAGGLTIISPCEAMIVP